MNNKNFRAGFVAVVGQPNVGKSTLINALLGTKVCIVSPKPQTTRTRVQAIINQAHSQIVLVDTPGLCEDTNPLSRAFRSSVRSAAAGADVVLVVVDLSDHHADILQAVSQYKNVFLAINKIDLLKNKNMLLPMIDKFSKQYKLAGIIPISAHTGDGLDELKILLQDALPEGAPLFSSDLYTDKDERSLCAEIIREQLLYQTHDEVPHSAVVVVESFTDDRHTAKPICYLECRIYIERESQKAIIIGRGGHQIKAIGTKARRHIETLLGCQVFLQLTVHVDPKWTTNPHALKRYGLLTEGSTP